MRKLTRQHTQGKNSKEVALNGNEKYKSKLFHVSTAQQTLPHRLNKYFHTEYLPCPRHTEKKQQYKKERE